MTHDPMTPEQRKFFEYLMDGCLLGIETGDFTLGTTVDGVLASFRNICERTGVEPDMVYILVEDNDEVLKMLYEKYTHFTLEFTISSLEGNRTDIQDRIRAGMSVTGHANVMSALYRRNAIDNILPIL